MRHRGVTTLWLLTDMLLFIASYALAYFLRVGFIFSTDFPFDRFLISVTLVAPFWLLVMLTTRAYGLTRSQTTPKSIAYILYACVIGNALFALTYYFLYGLFFSRLLLVESLLFSIIAILVWHVLYEKFQRKVLHSHPAAFPTLIVGVTRESKKLIELLKARKNPLRPVAILDGTGVKDTEIAGVPVVGKLNKLDETLEKYGITHLIQCSDLEQSINLLSACRNKGITYMILPSVMGIVDRHKHIEMLEGHAITLVSPHHHPLSWFFH